ncbi:MAG TPA: LytTR family DNA-binding domain-containing protein [Gemmatimonadaceae bacterium]|jgi:two-component system LytT family response regulator
MTPRTAVIADDEPLARERLRTMLQAHPEFTIAAECATGPETVDAILAHTPDLLFLDIKMPVLNGIEVLDALDELKRPPAIVFVTAFDEYAVKAFDLSVVDYLLKPFDRDRFEQALRRSTQRLHAADGATRAALDRGVRTYMSTLRSGREYPERFPVRGPRHVYFVQAADIDWVEASANYVQVHADGHVHFIRDTMTAFAEKLAPDRFIRVHRSVIVNIDRIRRIEPRGHGDYLITLSDGARLASSQGYNERLRDLLR